MSPSRKRSQREALMYHWNQGIHSARALHTLTNISYSTIYDNIKKLREAGTITHSKGNGRRKKISATISLALDKFICEDPTISTRTLAIKLANMGHDISYSTIGRHLASEGYKKSLPLQTPMLTAEHKRKRVEWAHSHLNDNWDRTFFTDETAFQLFRNTLERWYKGSRPVRRIPKDRSKINAWGGFCKKGKANLYHFRGIMNAEFYVGILTERIPEVRKMLGSRYRWLQDNDPKHTSHRARDFLAENVFEVMDWPSNSPDINPIENLWCIVKRNVERREPKNLTDLEHFLVEEWNKIDNDLLVRLVGSMRRRCELLIENDGERIAY